MDNYHFKPYHPIENSSREDYLQELKEYGLDQGIFVVQEKVHGGNLVFITDGKEIRCAKRTGLRDDKEKFFNFQKVRDRYRERILAAYKLVKELNPEMDELYIFGELFGGYYPHAQVPKVESAIKLQQGVFYSPDNDFYAFDLRVYNKSYLDLDISARIFEELGFIYAHNLFQGSLEECLAYPNEFESKIPEYLGLPLIPGNIAEGVVIKPLSVKFLPSKDRVILKNKNPKYEEKIVRKAKIKRPKPKVSDLVNDLRGEALAYINENRLQSVISKIGEVDLTAIKNDPKQIGKVLGPLAQDVLQDFLKDFGAEFEALEKTDQKLIKQFISEESMKLLRI